MFFESQKKIVFIGDSITDSGRRDVAIPYGNGYVSMVRNFLLAGYPELKLTIANRGVSGDTVRELAARWEKDVIAERPNYLSVCVGINDVIRQFSGDTRTAVYPEEYETTYRRLLQRAKDVLNPRFILMTPYIIETNREAPIRKQMDAYRVIVLKLAAEFAAMTIDLQAAFDEPLRFTPPMFWSGDQFHPNAPGNAVIAQAFLRNIQFEV